MKKTKRFLSVFIAITVLFSLVTVFANDVNLTDVDESTLTGKAVKELINYNIIDGYEDGTFKPDNTITRAEVAKIIVSFLNLSNIGADNLDSGFPDVDSASHWSKKYVRLAVDKGIVLGYEDGTFRPDNPVKYSEVVKMVVCALNYGSIAVQRTTPGSVWYAGYVSVAAEKGILKGASINSQDDPASRGNVAVLVYNSLEVVPAKEVINSSGEVSVVVDSKGKTAREDYLEAEKIDGVVTAVPQTSIYDENSGLNRRLIKVNDGKEENIYRVPAETDTYSLLGYRISADIRTDALDDYYSITNIRKVAKNNITVISPEDLGNLSTSSISYWASDNDKNKTNTNFDVNTTFIFNGKYCDADDLTDEDLSIKSGRVTILDNNDDGNVDVVFIDSYKVVAVKQMNTDSTTDLKKIYALYGEGDIVIPNNAKYTTINNNGTMVTIKDNFSVSKYDIVNLRESKDKDVFDLTITKDMVEGFITSKPSDYKIVINDKEYDIEYNFLEYTGADKPTLNVDSKVKRKVHRDMFGNIASVEPTSTAGTPVYVGYIVKADKEGGISGIAQIKLYGIAGSTGDRTYSLDKKVRIDGKDISDYSKMLEALEASALAANEGKPEEIKTGTYSQLIKYTLNGGLIDTIDTIAANTSVSTDDLEQTLPFPGSPNKVDGGYKYQSGVNTFIGLNGSTVIKLNSTNKILSINGDLKDIKSYSTRTNSSFSTGKVYFVEAYNLNTVGEARYIIVYNNAAIGDASFNDDSPVIITSKLSGVSEADKIEGWNFKTNEYINEILSDSVGLFNSSLTTGDIFRYTTDDDGRADKIEVMLDYNNGLITLFPDGKGNNAIDPQATAADAKKARIVQYDDNRTAVDSQCTLIYGTVIDINEDNSRMSVTTSLASDTDFISSKADLMGSIKDTYNVSNAKFYVLNTKATNTDKIINDGSSINEIFKLATISDENDFAEASQVLMYYAGTQIKAVIIIKF